MTSDSTNGGWDFDRWAASYDAAVAQACGYYERYEDVLAAVVRAAGVEPGKRVLDVGVGTGNLAIRCLAQGAIVVGIDPSEGMLYEARKKAADAPLHLLPVAEPFIRIPFPDASFDAVVSTYALHHVPRMQHPDAVRETARVLRPGGTIAIGDIAFESAQAEQEALHHYDWLEQEHFAAIGDLRTAFADLQMTLEAEQYTPIAWVLWAVKPHG